MRICFDFEIENKGVRSECPPGEQAALQEVDDAIYQRVSFYEEEIDKEEAENPDAMILVRLRARPAMIEPLHYSHSLTDKIQSTLGEDFSEKIVRQVGEPLQRFQHG